MQKFVTSIVCSIVGITLLPAATGKMENLQVGRYTRQGVGQVLVETGFYQVTNKNFSVNTSALYPESGFSVHGMTTASLTAINGKVVAFKATIDTYNQINPGFLDHYKFSKESYPTVGGASYIVTFATGPTTTAPTATVKVTKAKLKEGPKAKSSFVITLDKATKEDIVVIFKFGGSVKGSDDFLSSNDLDSVRIKKGAKTGKVNISLRNDKLQENRETLSFTILAHGGYKLGKPKTATITITDDDK